MRIHPWLHLLQLLVWLVLRLPPLIAIPLGSYMALFKNSWFDSISTATVWHLWCLFQLLPLFTCASSRFIFGLPDSFQYWSTGLAFICIAFSDSWFVECAIYRSLDSSLHDRYPFARFRPFCSFKRLMWTWDLKKTHLQNAMVPLVSGIPGSIIGVISGATLTETVLPRYG